MSAADLSRFADVIVPPPPPLWPPAPGWYVVAGLLLACLLQCGGAAVRRYRADRYRREALAELAALRTLEAAERFRRLTDLLRRTAIAAYGRPTVAALEGETWWRFLERTAPGNRFDAPMLMVLTERVLYANQPPDIALLTSFERACERWIRTHRRSAA